MVQKEKQVKSYTRKSKSGKQVQVKSYSAKYNSAEDMVKEALKQKKGAGKELLETKKKQKVENIPDYDFSMDDFAHWYEGDGSKQDKAVEKSLRKILGKKNYEALNDYVADNYKKGGHKSAFKKVSSFKEGATTKKASTAKSNDKSSGGFSIGDKVKNWANGGGGYSSATIVSSGYKSKAVDKEINDGLPEEEKVNYTHYLAKIGKGDYVIVSAATGGKKNKNVIQYDLEDGGGRRATIAMAKKMAKEAGLKLKPSDDYLEYEAGTSNTPKSVAARKKQ